MMDKKLFKQKYLGELTLRDGTHVKFLYPIIKNIFHTYLFESEQVFKNIKQYNNPNTKYWWVIVDDLSLIQFQAVYANIKKYGDNYWKMLWENRERK